ncbi:MAG: hypothetical protein IKP67_06825 [Spirochaetales bacterium]|nr:hypothetical protein [Spirochaetales bacterium]
MAMKRIRAAVLFLVTFLIIGCGIPTPKAVSGKPYLVTVGTSSETLGCLDEPDGTFQQSVTQTGQAPNDILQYNGSIYVLNSLSNSVTVYDEQTLKLTNEFSVGDNTNPYKFLILNEQLWITAYMTHQVLVYSLCGDRQRVINLDKSGEYYAFPEGITTDGIRIFAACKDSLTAGADTCDPKGGRVAVIRSDTVECYIPTSAADTNAVFVHSDRLYIISSGSWSGGFREDGVIESIALADISPTGENATNVHARDNSFGVCLINGGSAFCGNLGNGKLIRYDISDSDWTQTASLEFDGNGSLAFVSGMAFDTVCNILWVTEFNGNKLYRIDPATLTVSDHWSVSKETHGDAQGVLLLK